MFIGPVFAREIKTTARSWQFYFLRALYVAALFGLVLTTWLLLSGSQGMHGLGDLSRFGASVFALLAPIQLALAISFSALLTASAVAQEKDRRTLDLLLMTKLSNSELVLGKLLASMLSLLVLIIAAIPLLMLITLLGGVSITQVASVVGVTLTAALVSGSLGSTIALWREKSFQALAMTFLAIVLWLIAGVMIAASTMGQEWLGLSSRWWAEGLSPLRAMQAAMSPWRDENVGLPSIGGSVHLFMIISTIGALCLNLLAIVRVRVWNPTRQLQPQSTGGLEGFGRADSAPALLKSGGKPEEAHPKEIGPIEIDPIEIGPIEIDPIEIDPIEIDPIEIDGDDLDPQSQIAQTGPARRPDDNIRHVWDNPILWREIRTWAYGKKIILIHLVYLVVFAICTVSLFAWLGENGEMARGHSQMPLGAGPFASLIVVGLMLVNALAVTSLTNERDLRALDLLLVTDLTPKEIVFGKLWGIFYNAKEMILLPIVLALVLWSTGHLEAENMVFLAAALVVMNSFVAVLGIHAGMTYVNSRSAVAVSLGTLLFLLLGIGICMRMMLAFQGSFTYQLQAFSAFMVGGGIGLYFALGIRNPSRAIGWASFVAPFATFYIITSFLDQNYGAAFLVTAATYGFATAAMLIPALYEFDVATGRTTG